LFSTTIWRGTAMLLGATFFACCGAFILALRRFSLAGFLVSTFAAGTIGALTGGFAPDLRPLDYRIDSIPADPQAEAGIKSAQHKLMEFVSWKQLRTISAAWIELRGGNG